MSDFRLACVARGTLALAITVASGAAAQDAGDPFWNQPRGNAHGSAAVDVAPLQADPVERWRLALGAIQGEPVVWGDTLFVLTRDASSRTLHAISIASGELLAKQKLASTPEFSHLAVWQGTVAVVDPKALQFFEHRAGRISGKGALREEFAGPPCVADGFLFASGPDGRLACVDLGLRKLVAEVEGGGHGRPAFHAGRVMAFDVGPRPEYVGNYLSLLATQVTELGKRTVAFGQPERTFSGTVARSAKGLMGAGYVVVFETYDERHELYGEPPVSYVRSPVPLKTAESDTCPGAILPTKRLSTIESAPTAYGGNLFGFARDGTLVRQLSDGRYLSVVDEPDLPKGARPGDATRARSVAYLANWAVDLETGRVLWCLPELDVAGALIPAADERVVYWTGAGELVCLGAATSAGATSAAVPVAESDASRPTRPGSGDGVVLDDGRRLAGAVVRLADGGVRLKSESGAEETVPPARVALIEFGGRVELVGMEHAVLQAWLDALNADVVDMLCARFESYLGGRLVNECRRLLDDACERGIASAREAELRALLVGKAQSTAGNVELQRKKQLREELEQRRALADDFLAASSWCATHGLAAAATRLLVEATALCPEVEAVDERIAALVPVEFPWRAEKDAGARWARWAAELLPADGRFLAADDRRWRRVKETVWASDAIAIETPNLLLFSKHGDAAVVGACLRNGEAAVRALEALFGRAEGLRAEQPFEVRLHADKEAYLAERRPSGDYAMPWSVGYYSPDERVSRFYVPSSEEQREPLDRGLHKVFAHELTHQYLAQAWLEGAGIAGGDPSQPGFWVVEGVARFVEDQVVEMGRRGRRIDDETVKSLDATARLAEVDGLIPLARFVDLSQVGFAKLSDEREVVLTLRNTTMSIAPTERSIFYEQAGSLVFFMLHRRGDEGRAALREYLRAYYTRAASDGGWKALGFASASELDTEFRAFLAGLP